MSNKVKVTNLRKGGARIFPSLATACRVLNIRDGTVRDSLWRNKTKVYMFKKLYLIEIIKETKDDKKRKFRAIQLAEGVDKQ